MLRIGDFSKLSLVSVKTLRYYDELGLLKPVRVDDATGYRSIQRISCPGSTASWRSRTSACRWGRWGNCSGTVSRQRRSVGCSGSKWPRSKTGPWSMCHPRAQRFRGPATRGHDKHSTYLLLGNPVPSPAAKASTSSRNVRLLLQRLFAARCVLPISSSISVQIPRYSLRRSARVRR